MPALSQGDWLWAKTLYTYSDNSTKTVYTKSYVGTDGQNGQDGQDGQDGADGVGITSIVEEYYLSTSSTTQTGGSWSTSQPQWSTGKYIWTRSVITWDTTPATATTTTPVLAQALNGANATAASAQADATQALSDASDAAKVATNYLTYNSTNGLDVGYTGTQAKTRINGSGVEIFDSAGSSALFAGIENNKSIVRVGRAAGSGNVVISSDGYVDIRNASTVLAHFGWGSCSGYTGDILGSYYDIGKRKANTTIGYMSTIEGEDNEASGIYSHAEGCDNVANSYRAHVEGYKNTAGQNAHAEGMQNTASGINSHAEGKTGTASGQASHAEGSSCVASGEASHAGGISCEASGQASFAHGRNLIASGSHQAVFGITNVDDSAQTFIVGGGRGTTRANILTLTDAGNLWIAGTLTQNSDCRLKEHHAYLGEDACEFIRQLKPALFTKDGERHVGLYAQDVQEAEPEGWGTVTVTAQHTDESLDFDPLTLDYSALIAPLIAYCQQLEQRISQLEKLTRCG